MAKKQSVSNIESGVVDEPLAPQPPKDTTLEQILLAISAIEESVEFLETTAKANPKYRGKLVSLVMRMRPIVRKGGMTESLLKALQRG